jgi:hypothetical protein
VPRKRADVLGHAQIATTIGSYDGRRQVHRAAAKAIDAALGPVM